MMEEVDVMERTYDRTRSYERKEQDRSLGQCGKRLAKFERSERCVEGDRITIKLDEMARTGHVDVRRSFTASFVSGLVKVLKMSPIKLCFELLCKEATECGRDVPYTEPPRAYLKAGYMTRRVHLDDSACLFGIEFLGKQAKYGRGVRREFTTVRFRFSGDKTSCFMLGSGVDEEAGDL